ncbi:MAG: FHA domain-containing protein [Anaerolineae bacterium]|nr:FHA domain-containing protein [Anaerolineae bacterium]
MGKSIWWIKSIGGAWLALGAIAMVWSTWAWLNHIAKTPWTALPGLALGLAACVNGVGLLSKQGWAQGLAATTHALLAVYAFAALPLAYAAPQIQWLTGALWLVGPGNVILALLMSNAGVSEALSWLPLQTVYVQTLRCEFCGAPLDPQTETCPHCEAIPDIVREHLEPRQPRASLVNDEIGVQFPIAPAGKTCIGRGLNQNEINLNNPSVSRNHAWIEYQDGHFVLYASDDANGTFVNEQRVRQHELSDGDRVRFGRTQFRFVIESVQGK